MSASKPKDLAASSGFVPSQERNPQNFLLIWADANINQSKLDSQNTLTELRSIVNNVNLCTTADQCIQFLKDTQNEKAFLIVSGSLGETLVPQIHSLPQVDAIYVFCSNKPRHEQWAKQYVKIKGVHTNIEVICKELPIAAKQCNQDSVVVSIVSASEEASDTNLDQLEPSFMYTQIFKEILLEMEHDQKSLADLIAHCRSLYQRNEAELKTIGEFEKNYRPQSAIWWYTRECFTYQTLNRALRLLEADTIIKMGFLIRDLHQEIQKLYDKQINDYPEKCFTVYRGQGLSIGDFKRLQKSKGGLLSFNSFLSTSKSRSQSIRFATDALAKTNTVGILFKMSIDTSISSTPFAAVQGISYFEKEREILFSMHTVFRIGEMKRIDDTKELHQVDLKLTADDDEQFGNLTKSIRNEVTGRTGWGKLGSLLLKIDRFDKAEEVYLTLLEQTSSRREKVDCYIQLGFIRNYMDDYEKALDYYKKALELQEKIYPNGHPSFASTYNNLGGLYFSTTQYSKALLCYEKDLEISLRTISRDDQHFAVLYNNIGTVCLKMEEYSKALMFFEKVLKIEQRILPSNHPTLATTYSNIASTYASVKDYTKALPLYEKGLQIHQRMLPSKHHLLAESYNNLGRMYMEMKGYAKALTCFEHALQIYLYSHSPDHHVVKNVQARISVVKEKLGC